jgi:hypothetical protein
MNGCISDTLPVMERLLSHLEEFKTEMTASDSRFLPAVEAAWEKLAHYYKLSDQCPVYTIALVLDPRVKMSYFHRQWADNPEWIVATKTKVENAFHKYSAEYSVNTPGVPLHLS